MPVYLEGIGKNKSEIGIIIGAFFAASIILRPAVGVMLKTYSSKSLMILGSIIFVVAPALYLTTTSGVLFPRAAGLRLDQTLNEAESG